MIRSANESTQTLKQQHRMRAATSTIGFLLPTVRLPKSRTLVSLAQLVIKPDAVSSGVSLTDLTFFEDGNQDMVDGLINWNKRQMIASVIRDINVYQNSQG